MADELRSLIGKFTDCKSRYESLHLELLQRMHLAAYTFGFMVPSALASLNLCVTEKTFGIDESGKPLLEWQLEYLTKTKDAFQRAASKTESWLPEGSDISTKAGDLQSEVSDLFHRSNSTAGTAEAKVQMELDTAAREQQDIQQEMEETNSEIQALLPLTAPDPDPFTLIFMRPGAIIDHEREAARQRLSILRTRMQQLQTDNAAKDDIIVKLQEKLQVAEAVDERAKAFLPEMHLLYSKANQFPREVTKVQELLTNLRRYLDDSKRKIRCFGSQIAKRQRYQPSIIYYWGSRHSVRT